MKRVTQVARGIFLIFLLSGTAQAQVCRETGAAGTGPLCDHRYRDLDVACTNPLTPENPGTRPSCPPKPMPMISTPLASIIANYSPYLYAYPRDHGDPATGTKGDLSKPYNGQYLVGTKGGPEQVFAPIGNTAPGVKRIAACTTQLSLPGSINTTIDEARYVRLQMDNCTNQYILQTAMYPFQKSRAKLINDPTISSDTITLETECQPLKTFTETENEYDASEYLKAAWIKMLQDPTYRKTQPFQMPASLSVFATLLGHSGALASGEPSLPSGVKIDNPIAPPNPFPQVTLSMISASPYEEVNDPTHPFSPRWDFLYNDRDFYSLMTSSYMSKTTNAVYCAGVKDASSEQDAAKRADLEVKVDVLSFRREAFEDGLLRRIGYNAFCKADTLTTEGPIIAIALTSHCYEPVWPTVEACVAKLTAAMAALPFSAPAVLAAAGSCATTVRAKHTPCWKCFGLNDKVDDIKTFPPCTTHYDGKDRNMVGTIALADPTGMFTDPTKLFSMLKGMLSGHVYISGALNNFSLSPTCDLPKPKLPFNDKHTMDKLCHDLRRPYTQMNKLKMRYHNPADTDNVVLTNGVQEGMAFNSYFGNHMPYPRLWDTGLPLLKSAGADTNNQPPDDTTGQYTAIVGIGREAAPASAPTDANGNKPSDLHKDERCLLGGWGNPSSLVSALTGTTSFGGVTIKVPDPVSSWTEFKMYQMHASRLLGISCIGRYEKMFKTGSSEGLALSTGGGEWQRAIVTICDDSGDNCSYQSLQDIQKAGSAISTKARYGLKAEGWPMSWRGYMSALTSNTRFPNFGGSANLITGLDNAKVGDIVLMPYGAAADGYRPGLAKVGFVVQAPDSTCTTRNDCHLVVLEGDNGKWPDSCGITDGWGNMHARYLYKPGDLPQDAKNEYTRLNWISSCDDPKLAQCELNSWASLQLYRPSADERRSGCSQTNVAGCK